MPNTETYETVLSTGQAAKLCSVTRDTVLKWIKLGKIEAVQTPGGHYRIKRESLAPYISIQGAVQKPTTGAKPVTFCWEYHSGGGDIGHDCRKCMVFQARAQKCFLMAGLGEKGGHAGVHCKDNCYDCEYFHLISGGVINVLLVTENENLKKSIEAGISDRIVLRFASCEYETSSVVHDFRPDFVIVDDSLVSCRPEDICRHLIKDSRVGGAQIVMTVSEDRGRATLQEGVCASIAAPFSAREMEESFHQLRRSLWGGCKPPSRD
ncbi:MAG: helix-turn-helix domain-containing protein [Elusimicrobiota bacterium]